MKWRSTLFEYILHFFENSSVFLPLYLGVARKTGTYGVANKKQITRKIRAIFSAKLREKNLNLNKKSEKPIFTSPEKITQKFTLFYMKQFNKNDPPENPNRKYVFRHFQKVFLLQINSGQ